MAKKRTNPLKNSSSAASPSDSPACGSDGRGNGARFPPWFGMTARISDQVRQSKRELHAVESPQVNVMQYMINVDLETLNRSGDGGCRSKLHEQFDLHADLTIHRIGAPCR